MHRVLVVSLAVSISACGAAASVVHAPPEAPSTAEPETQAAAQVAEAPPPPAPADPCEGHDGLVVDAIEISSRWDGGALVVGGRAPLVVRWCGVGIAAIARIEVGAQGGGPTLYELDAEWARLTRGESLTRVITGRAAPSIQTIRVVGEVDGTPVEARAELHSVEPPELVSARAECAAANGTFGPVGMAQTLACTRPTHDAGMRCHASAECEGRCIADGAEEATSAPDGRDCPDGTTLRVRVGHCDDVVPHFGCVAELREPESDCAGPQTLRRGVGLICSD